MGAYVDDLLRDNQDVQLHIHPAWRSFEKGSLVPARKASDLCADYSKETLIELLRCGAEQLRSWTGEMPIALRTGNFSVSSSLFQAAKEIGLSTSSSICLGYAPPLEERLRVYAGAHTIEGVRSFPVTCFRDRGPIGRSRFRGFQITSCAQWEIGALLKLAFDLRYPYVIIVTHPFEFTRQRSGQLVDANRVNQSRFKWLCSFLARHSDRYSVVTMNQLSAEALHRVNERLPELVGGVVPSLLRTAQNVCNDHMPRLPWNRLSVSRASAL